MKKVYEKKIMEEEEGEEEDLSSGSSFMRKAIHAQKSVKRVQYEVKGRINIIEASGQFINLMDPENSFLSIINLSYLEDGMIELRIDGNILIVDDKELGEVKGINHRSIGSAKIRIEEIVSVGDYDERPYPSGEEKKTKKTTFPRTNSSYDNFRIETKIDESTSSMIRIQFLHKIKAVKFFRMLFILTTTNQNRENLTKESEELENLEEIYSSRPPNYLIMSHMNRTSKRRRKRNLFHLQNISVDSDDSATTESFFTKRSLDWNPSDVKDWLSHIFVQPRDFGRVILTLLEFMENTDEELWKGVSQFLDDRNNIYHIENMMQNYDRRKVDEKEEKEEESEYDEDEMYDDDDNIRRRFERYIDPRIENFVKNDVIRATFLEEMQNIRSNRGMFNTPYSRCLTKLVGKCDDDSDERKVKQQQQQQSNLDEMKHDLKIGRMRYLWDPAIMRDRILSHLLFSKEPKEVIRSLESKFFEDLKRINEEEEENEGEEEQEEDEKEKLIEKVIQKFRDEDCEIRMMSLRVHVLCIRSLLEGKKKKLERQKKKIDSEIRTYKSRIEKVKEEVERLNLKKKGYFKKTVFHQYSDNLYQFDQIISKIEESIVEKNMKVLDLQNNMGDIKKKKMRKIEMKFQRLEQEFKKCDRSLNIANDDDNIMRRKSLSSEDDDDDDDVHHLNMFKYREAWGKFLRSSFIRFFWKKKKKEEELIFLNNSNNRTHKKKKTEVSCEFIISVRRRRCVEGEYISKHGVPSIIDPFSSTTTKDNNKKKKKKKKKIHYHVLVSDHLGFHRLVTTNNNNGFIFLDHSNRCHRKFDELVCLGETCCSIPFLSRSKEEDDGLGLRINYKSFFKSVSKISELCVMSNINFYPNVTSSEFCWKVLESMFTIHYQSAFFQGRKLRPSFVLYEETRRYIVLVERLMNENMEFEADDVRFLPMTKEFERKFKKNDADDDDVGNEKIRNYIRKNIRSCGESKKEFSKNTVFFKSHKQLDMFVGSCFQIDPFFKINEPGVYQLLKGFDEAFWNRLKSYPDDEKLRPGGKCFFKEEGDF